MYILNYFNFSIICISVLMRKISAFSYYAIQLIIPKHAAESQALHGRRKIHSDCTQYTRYFAISLEAYLDRSISESSQRDEVPPFADPAIAIANFKR